ncbi:hypothetical protein EK21DRAFT_58440 [Setomelanomma holmii]|uniref:Tat pathway signal sequence protein n=1 Tax=Setomelanomma holmii TaxID=210430 RepID=A0A9P4LR83_9PLEO|nr:hypothetical protein EK21DRAFT_58440 [Setomelanomma holmii]
MDKTLTILAPASTITQYIPTKHRETNETSYSPLAGNPTKENIEAWEELIQPMVFSATESDLVKAGEPLDASVRLAKGGYVAALGVYHELHCLRQLRLFLYSDVLYPNLTTDNIRYLQGHLGTSISHPNYHSPFLREANITQGHCLETIRVSLMCSADTSMYTFEWVPEDHDRPHPRSHAVRNCVNWDKVEAWANERKVPLDPMLIRPQGEAERIHL